MDRLTWQQLRQLLDFLRTGYTCNDEIVLDTKSINRTASIRVMAYMDKLNAIGLQPSVWIG